ncbi:hypothetical protein CYY_000179 [Polysphondylium violaceum]|uniref:Uncharacterized protein n=1 Tax=Polysphondylium violaceum TaxID=133409 RepID=A0A8J4UXH9_9MYCE|nr:hypothetical protein CYY_000179 [Polysphondylium violaceum]
MWIDIFFGFFLCVCIIWIPQYFGQLLLSQQPPQPQQPQNNPQPGLFYLVLQLFKQIDFLAALRLLINVERNKTVILKPHPGAVWISDLTGDSVVSAYYHPTKRHTSTTIGALSMQRSTVGPGEWAYSRQTRAASGNRTFYNTLDL